ncbi:MAG: hypothetical protein Q9226_007011 [Calogaya cf. arnoldii]
MRSLMLILVCALSVSARCVKRQGASTKSPAIQKAGVSKVAPQAGPRRMLLEESSAGLENSTNTASQGDQSNQGDQANKEETDQSNTSTGSGDTSNTDQTSTTNTDGSSKDTQSSEGTSTTNTDGSSKDTSSSDGTSTTNSDGSSKDTSSSEGTSTTKNDGSSKDTQSSEGTSTTNKDDSSKDTSNTENKVPIPSSGPGDVSNPDNDSTNGGDNSGKDSSSSGNNPTSSGAGGSGNATLSTETSPSTGGGRGSGNCGTMKNVCFNAGMQPSMFDGMETASNWITFGLDIPGGTPSSRAKQAHIPMMAFAEHVAKAIELVNGPDAPEWMLTFNEPDYSYVPYNTPTMTGAQAAKAIAPLLAKRGSKTKFVAPVTAAQNDPFLDDFFAACNCKDFFSAYNFHTYEPDAAKTISNIQAYHSKWNDKPLWITEIAPGGSCGKSPETVGQFFKDIFKFAKKSGFVDRVFWNTGNKIDQSDQNVCDSWLMDGSGKPGPLMPIFEAIDCS